MCHYEIQDCKCINMQHHDRIIYYYIICVSGLLLPFGPENGDNQLLKTDDGASSGQTDATYTFFGTNESLLYVSHMQLQLVTAICSVSMWVPWLKLLVVSLKISPSLQGQFSPFCDLIPF